ncbi:hypothetical protein LMG24235_07266 [Paraburkholderia sabiae]|nr:hypothetical protein LMG24235_07266 [Paraburkholderia sabiae]
MRFVNDFDQGCSRICLFYFVDIGSNVVLSLDALDRAPLSL